MIGLFVIALEINLFLAVKVFTYTQVCNTYN